MAGLIGKKKNREAEIPTASMADIAFLLLIFFLVTTTIDVDTGIGMVLPPKLDDTQKPPPVKDRNMLKILTNEQGQVLLEEKPSSIQLIRDEVKKQVLNCVPGSGYDCNENYSESPNKSVVSIKTTRETPYEVYVAVMNEVWMAYFEMWDAEARKLGYPNYKAYAQMLEDEGKGSKDNLVRQKIKANISIAEPDAS